MLGLLVLTSLAAVVLAEPQPRFLENGFGRIVGGEGSGQSTWEWQISVQYKSGTSYYHICGGTLIGPRWVLTAAHCVDSPRTLRVVAGERDLTIESGYEQFIQVSQVYIHPKWDSSRVSDGFDIALLHLSSDAIVNYYVGLGLLPPANLILPKFNFCYITGWGSTVTGGPLSPKLRQAYLPVVDHATCSKYDWWGSTVKTTMVCAGWQEYAGCHGDDGGPLNCYHEGEWYAYGITSFVSSMGCDTPQKPTVFTRVSAYIDWIDSIIN